jgi:hypothetical protein
VGADVPFLAQDERDRLGAASNSELAEDSLDVCRRRLGTDHEAAGDLFLGEALGQQIENLVLSLCQGLQLPIGARPVAVRASPIQEAYDARDQLTRIDRLDQVVVGPDQHAAGAIERIGPLAGDEDDRDRVAVAVAERAADLVAVQAGQLNVEEDDSRRLVGDRRQNLGAARETPGGVTDPLE